MSQFYCHPCAITNNIVIPAEYTSLTGTSYQLDKYLKHTVPADSYQYVSVFHNSDYENYRGFVVTGTISGMLEIDDFDRKNWIWYAARKNWCFICGW